MDHDERRLAEVPGAVYFAGDGAGVEGAGAGLMGDRYNKHLYGDEKPWPLWAKIALGAFLLLGVVAILYPIVGGALLLLK